MVFPDTAVAGPDLVRAKSIVRGALAATLAELSVVSDSILLVVSVAAMVATLVNVPVVPGNTTPTMVIVVWFAEPTSKLPTSIIKSSGFAAVVS